MAKRSQSGRSSRPGLIDPHKQLSEIDSRISKLENAIRLNEVANPKLAKKQKAERDLLDSARKATRKHLKRSKFTTE